MKAIKTIGLIINPIAGIGGPAGLKGSDGEEIQKLAMSKGAVKRAGQRAKAALSLLGNAGQDTGRETGRDILLLCGPGEMGEDVVKSLGLPFRVVETRSAGPCAEAADTAEDADGSLSTITTAADTEAAAARMKEEGAELIVFAGGDGTARNVLNAIGDSVPVIGIPAGVKIHSGVFATSPEAASRLISAFIGASRVPVRLAEVIDLNEEEYRKGRIGDTLYGYMNVPVIGAGMQNPKAASHSSDDDIGGICQEIREKMLREDEDTVFILCAGSTVFSLKKALGLDGTLLGIDVARGGVLTDKDVSADILQRIVEGGKCRLILTAIGGQGHIFGRGNQQLTPDIIRRVGRENIWIIAAASKIYGLPEQTLYVDTGDPDLDEELRGYWRVIVGWQETLICRVM